MENGPFIDGLPIKISIYRGFSMAMLNNQRVSMFIKCPFHLKNHLQLISKTSGNHIYLQAFVIFQDNFKQTEQLLTMNKYINETII